MKNHSLNIIGLMTGTSMDGIDISLVKTNGENLVRLDENYYYKYSNQTKDFLLDVLLKEISFNLDKRKFLDNLITDEHYLALKDLDITKKSDLIGFHGQTIYHNPERKISVQLGNPKKLAQMLKKNIVFDFRSNDINLGGHGAPLAPIYHKFIIESLNLKLPSCILNIGGVANISYWDDKTIIGFDTGPGNALMDDFVRQICNKDYDNNGILASKGIADQHMVKRFINQKFFKLKPPKSLDRNSFINFYNELLNQELSICDTLATLLECNVESIISGIKHLPKTIENILVTGGGYRNKYLMKRLKDKIDSRFLNEEELGLNFDYIEAELIAYLSARSIYKLPFTFPTTTGVAKPSTGGKLYRYS